MKPLLWIGVLLMFMGGAALAYRGFSYTDREKIVDIGPIEATAEREKTVSIPPVLGGVLLVAGAVLTVAGARRKAG